MHSITVLPGSGEYALNRILEPGAWGRRPLATKLTQLKMPVTFICKFTLLLFYLTV